MRHVVLKQGFNFGDNTIREIWLSKMQILMVSPRFSKGCEVQIGRRIMCKWSLTTPLIVKIFVVIG